MFARPELMAAALLAIASCWATPSISYAQFRGETAADSGWKLIRHDCHLPSTNWQQQKLPRGNPNQPAREQIDFVCGHGSEILVAREIDHCLLIADLSLKVDVKAQLPGVQLLLRVVLPQSASNHQGQPVRVMLPGPITQGGSEWETLSMGEGTSYGLQRLLQEQTWGLRSQSGSSISLENAYIDQVLLNLYTGPGRQRVELAALQFQGAIAADQFLDSALSRWRDPLVQQASHSQDGRQDAPALRNGTVIEIGGRLFFPRIVQHNGESLEFLRSLGFNTVQLSSSATDVQLVEARQSGMWIICPPPPSLGIKPLGAEYDRVLAWSLGEDLGDREVSGARQRAQEIRDYDSRRGRLITVAAGSEWSLYSGFCDALCVGQPTMGGTFPLSKYGEWLHECSVAIGHAIPLWVDIDTELPHRLLRQAAALGGQVPPTPIHHQQALFSAFEAVSAGARGLRYKSRQRLDATDPATRLRAMTLTWLNRRMEQLEPWAMGGARLGEVHNRQDGLTVTALKTNRAQLLLVQRKSGWEHRVSGDAPVQSVAVRDIYSGVADRAYLLSEHGLPLLQSQATGAGATIEIENCPASAAVVLTQDPQVIANLSLPPGSDQRSLVSLHVELVRQWLAVLQLVDNQLTRLGRGSPAASGALNDAFALLRNADELLRGGSPASAIVFVDQADQRLAMAIRAMLATANQPFRDHVAAPLLAHVCLLPSHWQLAEQMSQTEWRANGLAGGDFENLQQMINQGWQNVRSDHALYQTHVELSPAAAWQSGYGLHLSVKANQPSAGLPQQIPLEIRSAPVSLPAGQMVRIHGYVQIPQALSEPTSALVISDNLGGEALALRIAQTEGWREFVIYRATFEPTDLRLHFQLTGAGEVWLDEITVRTTPVPVLSLGEHRQSESPRQLNR